MPRKKRDISDPEVFEDMMKWVRSLTPEERYAQLVYRTPGVEVTDMTGMYADYPELPPTLAEYREMIAKMEQEKAEQISPVTTLDADVRKAFPTDEEVNRALRSLMADAQTEAKV